MLSQILNIDTIVLSNIFDLHTELLHFQVCEELQTRQRHYRDRYIVSTEPDTFFGRRQNAPLIPQTTMISRNGIKMTTEPHSLNRRYRRQTLHEIIDM